MRLLLPFLFLPLAGCAVFFSEGDREIGVIPVQTTSSVVIRAVLPRDAHDIRFACATPVSSTQAEQRVTVSLTNTSTRTIELGRSSVASHGSTQLYDGSLSALISDRRFALST